MKPVLYRYKDTESVIKVMDGYTPGEDWTPLYTTPQPERKHTEAEAPTSCTCPTRDALDAMLVDTFKRRAVVEQSLFDMAAGKLPMPDAAKLREMAIYLGVPKP